MRIIEVEQGSLEWFECRMGIPTASELDCLITPKWAIRKGQQVDSYLARKLAERWRGEPLPSFQSAQMEQGQIREKEAIPWYEFETGRSIKVVGFVTNDAGKVGCSPDGLFDDGTGIEIKCPECPTHVRYLLDGELPDDYRAQVQGSMFVTGAARWTFLSYCRGFPPFVLTVERDEQAQEAIGAAASAFNDRLEAGWRRLVDLNGGVPSPREQIERVDAAVARGKWDLELAG